VWCTTGARQTTRQVMMSRAATHTAHLVLLVVGSSLAGGALLHRFEQPLGIGLVGVSPPAGLIQLQGVCVCNGCLMW
jgi:hypothetical protein